MFILLDVSKALKKPEHLIVPNCWCTKPAALSQGVGQTAKELTLLMEKSVGHQSVSHYRIW